MNEVRAAERHERSIALLKAVGVDHRANHMPHELWGGIRSRVVRALANSPALLFCDEHTGDLDHKTGNEIIKLMRDMAKETECAVLVVTHDPEVARMADQALDR
jgi:ABC-type lipoprotein export system ATPase subunit